MATSKEIAVINVPEDVDSMIKGKHLAPQAFKSAGLVSKLESVGYRVSETEALSEPQIWSSEATFEPNGVRNEQSNVKVCRELKEAVGDVLRSASPPPFELVIGGGCGIVPAILSAYWTQLAPKRIGLMYVDADADLTVPDEASSSGNLASMAMTHLVLREGCLKSMHEFSRPNGTGVVDPSNAVIFGLNSTAQGNSRPQLAYLFDEGYRVITSSAVAADPERRAKQALEWLEERVDYVFVHLDVDAIDGTTFPLANVPNRTGAKFEQIMAAIKIFLNGVKTVGLCVAEVNPDHDPDLKMTRRLVEGLTDAMRGRLKG